MTRKLMAEFIGTMFLLIGIVASAIFAWDISGGNDGLALLINSLATGAVLFTFILTLGPVSGAHFNPAVTLMFALRGEHRKGAVLPYIVAQIAGGIVGVWLSHLMFDQPLWQVATNMRSTPGLWLSEVIGTFGLLFVIFGGLKSRPDTVPALVGVYVGGAYWFTASSSFANPAVTIARALTDTPTGINPASVPMYLAMELVGLAIAAVVISFLFARS